MKLWILFFSVLTLFLSPRLAFAVTDVSAFRNFFAVPRLQITEPTVAELAFPTDGSVDEVLVLENESQTAQPITNKLSAVPDTNFSVTTPNGNGAALTDSNRNTYVDYHLTTEGINETTLSLQFNQQTEINGVFLEFSDFSRSPDSVKVHTSTNGQNQIILNSGRYAGSTIRFPEVAVTNLVITLSYSQPIRITRVGVFEVKQQNIQKEMVRFLAKPGMSYTLYLNADRSVPSPTGQAGNLFAEANPVQIAVPAQLSTNPQHIPSDRDQDGVPDTTDNCPNIANPDQEDSNDNGIGDVCEDTDYDGVIDSLDNCPEHANSNQSDVDGDGIGDACDDQESRFTEQYPWLPWVAMGGTAVVISALVFQMSRSNRFAETSEPENPAPPIEK